MSQGVRISLPRQGGTAVGDDPFEDIGFHHPDADRVGADTIPTMLDRDRLHHPNWMIAALDAPWAAVSFRTTTLATDAAPTTDPPN